MFEETKGSHRVPGSVDEAADLLLSDLLTQHLQTLTKMSEGEFNQLCDKITPYLLSEFKTWEGNDALLNSCFAQKNNADGNPARIILNRAIETLNDFHDFLVIT